MKPSRSLEVVKDTRTGGTKTARVRRSAWGADIEIEYPTVKGPFRVELTVEEAKAIGAVLLEAGR